MRRTGGPARDPTPEHERAPLAQWRSPAGAAVLAPFPRKGLFVRRSEGLQDNSIRGIDAHRPDVAGLVQHFQNVNRANAVVVRLGPHDARLEPLLSHFNRLVHGDAGGACDHDSGGRLGRH